MRKAVSIISECKKYTSFREIPKFTRDGSYAVDVPLDRVSRWVAQEQEELGLELNPEFQRGHVWTKRQQVAYMEFLLRGGRTGRDFYFNYPSMHIQVPDGAYNAYVCVDGLQRLTAIQKFFGNELKVFGSFFWEYTDRIRISMNSIRVHVNDLKTEKEVLQWYIEMNSGGTPHSKTEITRVKTLLDSLEKNDN